MENNRDWPIEHERQQKRRNCDALSESGADRLRRLFALQAQAMEVLQSSPHGMRHFLQRNYRSRQARLVDGIYRPVSTDRYSP
jgi:hypothetical protein